MQLELEPDAVDDQETAIDPDGFVYRLSDGEVIGRADRQPQWRPESRDDVEWTLEVRAKIEADLAAIQIRQDAILANLAKLRKREERRLAYWDWRFGPDVVAFARKDLAGGKSRTLQLDNGKVAFRTTAGTNKIVDLEAAVAYVEARDPLKVKVSRSVTATDVMKVAAEHADTRPTMAHFLYSTGPSESVSIETGVGG